MLKSSCLTYYTSVFQVLPPIMLRPLKLLEVPRLEKHSGTYPVASYSWAKPKRQSSGAKTYVNTKIASKNQTQKPPNKKKYGKGTETFYDSVVLVGKHRENSDS